MRTRPWPIIILAVLYILGPVFNTFTGALMLHVPYGQYLHALFRHSSWLDLSKLLLLYPIAGIAIYAVKNWSYTVYLLVMGLTTYYNFQDWRHYSNIFTLPMFIATTLFNIVLVSYFLIPAVRVAYFNKRLRWWESKPRYDVRLRAVMETAQGKIRCSILNLAEGGAFIKASKHLEVNSAVELQILILSQAIRVPAKIVHMRQAGVGEGFGLQFQHTKKTEQRLKEVIRALRLIGLTSRTMNPPWTESLKTWALTLFRTGKGLIPDVPQAATAPASSGLIERLRKRLQR